MLRLGRLYALTLGSHWPASTHQPTDDLKTHATAKATGAVVFSVAVVGSAYALQTNGNSIQHSTNATNHAKVQASVKSQSISQGATDATTNSDVNVSTSSNQGTAHTQVTVNGQPVQVPQNGTVTQTTNNGTSTTTTSVSSSTQGSARNSNSVSTRVQVHSQGSSISNQVEEDSSQ